MSPADRQMLDELRAAVARKTDPVERKELEDKLAFLERAFATEASLKVDTAAGEALLAQGRRAVLWGRLVIAILIVALLGTVAWFWGFRL